MRIDHTHPDARRMNVYFNGELQTRCLEVDTEAGWIIRFLASRGNPPTIKMAALGNPYAPPRISYGYDQSLGFWVEQVTGKVEVVRK
jgi:hypothetical protein